MTKNAAWANDQIVHAGRNRLDLRRTNEYAEWVMLLRHAPRTGAGLREVHLAIPTSQNEILRVSPDPGETQAFPEPECCREVIVGDNRESADCFRTWHHASPWLSPRRFLAEQFRKSESSDSARFLPSIAATIRIRLVSTTRRLAEGLDALVPAAAEISSASGS